MNINLAQNKNFKLFKIISEVAEKNNQSVFIVGGFVRDLILKRQAPTDIDFVTEGNGINLAKAIAQFFCVQSVLLFGGGRCRTFLHSR